MPSTQINNTAIVPDSLHGLRLDQALAQLFPAYSRSRLQTWVQAGQVSVDQQLQRSKDKVYAGQHILIAATLAEQTPWKAQSIPLSIVYEDDSLLVVNKPPGLVVHPAAGNPDKTLLNALLHHAPDLQMLPRAGIVHRLDKDTSGLLAVAKTLQAHTTLVTQIQNRTMKREYFGLVSGVLTSGGTIAAPMGRHPRHRTQMAVLPPDKGKPATTHYRISKRYAHHTAVQVFLETGRTHQIRVHLAHIGYPLVGDPTYGGRLKIPAGATETLQMALRHFKRQALHAKKLMILHPVSGVLMQWEAPLPEDLVELLSWL